MADVLAAVLERSRELGFLGPGPASDQRTHAEAFLTAIDLAGVARVVDLGSGGGVPGLVLAALLPHTRWVLLDAMQRRTTFLLEAVALLGLEKRVKVRTTRAEDAGRSDLRGANDLVVARSFAGPAITVECAAPLLRVGGQLVVSEPPSADGRWPAAGLNELGMILEEEVPGPPSFVRLRQAELAPASAPRRSGLPAKRPRW